MKEFKSKELGVSLKVVNTDIVGKELMLDSDDVCAMLEYPDKDDALRDNLENTGMFIYIHNYEAEPLVLITTLAFHCLVVNSPREDKYEIEKWFFNEVLPKCK